MNKTNKNSLTQTTVHWLPEGKWGGEQVDKSKRDLTHVDRGDLNLGGEYTVQYTDDVFLNFVLEIYMVLLINVTIINLILKNRFHLCCEIHVYTKNVI